MLSIASRVAHCQDITLYPEVSTGASLSQKACPQVLVVGLFCSFSAVKNIVGASGPHCAIFYAFFGLLWASPGLPKTIKKSRLLYSGHFGCDNAEGMDKQASLMSRLLRVMNNRTLNSPSDTCPTVQSSVDPASCHMLVSSARATLTHLAWLKSA